MGATTRALRMVQDGSFSVPSGAFSAEISRTIRDPTDRESAVSAVNTHLYQVEVKQVPDHVAATLRLFPPRRGPGKDYCAMPSPTSRGLAHGQHKVLKSTPVA